MKGNESTKLFGTIIVLAVISVAALVFSVFNVLGIVSAKDTIKQEEATLSGYKQKIESLENLKARADEIEAEIAEYTELLPIGMNQAYVLTKLHNVFEQYQVDVSQVQINQSTDVENSVSKIPVTFTASGNYNSIMAMLEEFAVTNPIATVDNITISKSGGDSADISFNVMVSFYYINA